MYSQVPSCINRIMSAMKNTYVYKTDTPVPRIVSVDTARLNFALRVFVVLSGKLESTEKIGIIQRR